MMISGKAIGGPLDGVKVTAGVSWFGTIPTHRLRADALVRYYPGRYVWNIDKSCWVWQDN